MRSRQYYFRPSDKSQWAAATYVRDQRGYTYFEHRHLISVFVSGRLDVLRERVGRGGRVAFQGGQGRDNFVIDRFQVQYH